MAKVVGVQGSGSYLVPKLLMVILTANWVRLFGVFLGVGSELATRLTGPRRKLALLKVGNEATCRHELALWLAAQSTIWWLTGRRRPCCRLSDGLFTRIGFRLSNGVLWLGLRFGANILVRLVISSVYSRSTVLLSSTF